MIYGYANFKEAALHATPITLGIEIPTRRSRFRAGTRYFRRGIDADGNVGNFNETEQFLITWGATGTDSKGNQLFAFLQTRGSVPVYWAEINNLKYKPELVLGGNSIDATEKHFDQQIQLYGDNYLVNLVNQSGHELPVKQAYEAIVEQLGNPKLHYKYFDFHHECRHMQWHRVKLLIQQLNEMGLQNTDFFHKTFSSNDGQTIQVLSEQQSTVRTNCMDCLDRTNVVQSVLAHWVLQREFESAGVIEPGSNQVWENDSNLLSIFQNMWADNADAVSISYAGTGALKTDFTRTGKRTMAGAFADFINSASRYYKNNLTDGPDRTPLTCSWVITGPPQRSLLALHSKIRDHLWFKLSLRSIRIPNCIFCHHIFPKRSFYQFEEPTFLLGFGCGLINLRLFNVK